MRPDGSLYYISERVDKSGECRPEKVLRFFLECKIAKLMSSYPEGTHSDSESLVLMSIP